MHSKRKYKNMKAGILSCQEIKHFLDSGFILCEYGNHDPSQIQPASLDLRLSSILYRVQASFLPDQDKDIEDILENMILHKIRNRENTVLEPGCVYIAKLIENLSLPEGIQATSNAKSTTGRLDIFTRLLANRSGKFDIVPKGYSGPLYMEISPRTFSIQVQENSRLNQIRFFSEKSFVEGTLQNQEMRVDLRSSKKNPIGYKAKRHSKLIDFESIGTHEISEFWEPIYAPNREIILEPGSFYILASKESVRISPGQAAEMIPYIPSIGEFRAHYAGFFDPGFGYGLPGDLGAKSVLEVRCHEVPFLLRDGQVIGNLVFENMKEIPDYVYGKDSNYQGQHLKLAKQFKSPES